MTDMNEDDVFGILGDTTKGVRMHKHITFETGRGPDGFWAMRLTMHPFRTEADADRAVNKMKKLLRPLGFSFRGDPSG